MSYVNRNVRDLQYDFYYNEIKIIVFTFVLIPSPRSGNVQFSGRH